MEMNMLKLFFENLAERMNKENNLSDITYTLCKINADFKKFFLSFCFDENIDSKDLNREYYVGNSRVDFYFYDLDNKEKLIEVKINDKKQHFGQYEKDFPNAEYAFIANYKYEPRDKWIIKTWKDFYDKLFENTKLKYDCLISGYMEYLKSVICIKEFQVMDLNKVDSLSIFYDNLINILVNDFCFSPDNSLKSCCNNYYGQFFYKNVSNETLYLWFGIYLGKTSDNRKSPIYIGLKDNENWVPLRIRQKMKDCNDGDYWFSLKNKKFEVLCGSSKSSEDQKDVIKNFFEEVMQSIDAQSYLQ